MSYGTGRRHPHRPRHARASSDGVGERPEGSARQVCPDESQNIPTFFVPLFLLVHGLTFKRIARMSAPTATWAPSRRTVA